MAGRRSRFLILVVGLLIVLPPAGGCRRQKTPDTKQARLIAAESMQLKKRLADLEDQIGTLKARHADDLEQREDQLAASRKRIDALEKDLQQGIAERVKSVTAAVMDENTRLRREITRLRAEIAKLNAQPSPAP